MMRGTNVKHSKICAFCKNWYDPTNSAIVPRNTVGGFWEYDDSVWNICKQYGTKRSAGSGCNKFYECKV
ncbi:MAG: hypothetical protein IKN12_07010 [Selenomonadaceae bacterium]|nr:hypothetical protein [Selenomonadaceae bacterium]